MRNRAVFFGRDTLECTDGPELICIRALFWGLTGYNLSFAFVRNDLMITIRCYFDDARTLDTITHHEAGLLN